MDLQPLLKGLIIGISIAAPVGPIGVLCIQRTLSGGRWHGLVSGLGAASADAIYGTIAAFGVTVITSALVENQTWLRLIGGAFLIFLGVRAMVKHSSELAPQSEPSLRHLQAYGSTFALTLTNPMTILSFAAVFVGLGVGEVSDHYMNAILIVLGVFTGSAIWWGILSSITSLLRSRLRSRHLVWINRGSGAILLGFGIMALVGIAQAH